MIKQYHPDQPSIIVAQRINADGEREIATVPLNPKGMFLQSCGRIYQVDARGTQRRVKE